MYVRKRSSGDGRSFALPLWEHLDNPKHTDVNLLVTDLQEMYNGRYKAPYTHPLVTWMNSTEDEGLPMETDHTGATGTAKLRSVNPCYSIIHRLPWLRWIGEATLESRSGHYDLSGGWVPDFTVSLGNKTDDTNSPLLQAIALGSVSWLGIGQTYAVRGARVAYEDYDL
jgi:hypothetical protein